MIKIGSLNVRGINQDLKQKMVATDFKDYNLDILLVQETHIKQNCNIKLRNFNNDRYILNNSGRTSFCGVGFIVNKNINYDFFPVNDRMCYITCYLNNTKINIINVYAPTETSCVPLIEKI